MAKYVDLPIPRVDTIYGVGLRVRAMRSRWNEKLTIWFSNIALESSEVGSDRDDGNGTYLLQRKTRSVYRIGYYHRREQ